MRIGLLGGAFDPPHNAHLEIAQRVRAAHALERVDLLVSGVSPHAGGKSAVAAVEHRLAMARLAVAGVTGLGVEDCETRRIGRSFTVDTLRLLRELRPDDGLYFIIGGDMLADLPTWKNVDQALDLARFVPVFRPGFNEEVFKALEPKLGRAVVAALRANVVQVPLLDVSSSAIRAAVAAGESISQWVPPAVGAYIRAMRLYLP